MKSNRNPGIQWMRALAALLVVVDHCLYTLAEKAGGDSAHLGFAAFLGGSGVHIFFIISGLVMVLSSTRAFGAAASGEFLRRRLIRIVPLYWLTTLVYTGKLLLTGETVSGADFLRSLFFIPYLAPFGEVMPVYGLGWTLNYEMFFYGVFALGLLWSLRTTLLLCAVGLISMVLLGLSASRPDADPLLMPLYFWSRPIVLFFLGGMALPFIVARLNRRGPSRLGLAFEPAALLSLLLAGLALAASWTFKLPVPLELVLLALPVLVASMAQAREPHGLFATIATRLGDASYSIYLVHSFVIGPLARLYAKLGLDAPLLFILLSLVICSCVGMLSFRIIETPIIRWLSARTSRPIVVSTAR